MKKFIVIAGLVGIAALAVGVFSQAFAQTEPPHHQRALDMEMA